MITIGLLEWSIRDQKLKPKRGKRLALRVSNIAPYYAIKEKAKEKWKNYHYDDYNDGSEYILAFEGGRKARLLPGTSESFNLLKYQEELNKDYKRIVLYLCTC